MKFNIATLPGDGVGPEIISEGIKVLQAAEKIVSGFSLDFQKYDAGAGHYVKTGDVFPDSTYEECKESDAIFLGSMGIPEVVWEDGTEVQGKVILTLRFELDLFAGVRPVKLFEGVKTPLENKENIDLVIVRENTEGLFTSFKGGSQIVNQVVADTMMISRTGTEKICDYAFKLAQKRNGRVSDGQKIVTCCDKSNVFKSLAFFRKVYTEVADQYKGEVATDYAYIDALSLWLIQNPQNYDVIVSENMFGDILSDLVAALVGGMGMAPSGDIGYDHAMFQPAHGSAPTIAGKGIANPIATILSGSMMLDWLADKHQNEAARQAASLIEKAVARAVASGVKTRDIGGESSTVELGDAIVKEMEKIPLGELQ
ncbi:isocitrate/isopropylmalate dehydrogenase family protein [Alkalihalobacillus oceani]|uniref:3-isopropylmalate dehydrogenase n=1 Tax=Halalkalibacter oceani TaxID=1653776 RepID=A0A9X2INN0_9BACI|nr:isocitrate/isopropylmalate dehydrogenase family protein [Halalkalibacter oceani]MCM3713961.1 isocitrate/isopropylmalate dehydrogenase family protein [Halalkalibacter oceani]